MTYKIEKMRSLLVLVALGKAEHVDGMAGILSEHQTKELAEMSDEAAKVFIDKLFDSIDKDKNELIDSEETIAWIRIRLNLMDIL